MTLVDLPCALCGSSSLDPVFGSTIADSSADPHLFFSSSRERTGHLPIVRCRACGLLFTNPRDDDETLGRAYAALEDRVYLGEEASHSKTARRHLALVSAHIPKPGRILDIGCATGAFVCAARREGWAATGVDASAWAIARAQERCPEGIFKNSLLEDADFESFSFTAVTLWDVLEHVRSPAETLTRARNWLSPEGWIFLNLPNANSMTARLLGRHWVLLLREHLWYFSPETIRRLLREAGFDLVETRSNLVRHSLANIAGRLAQYPTTLGRAVRPFARSRLLKHISVRFPIGEMSVVARKRA